MTLEPAVREAIHRQAWSRSLGQLNFLTEDNQTRCAQRYASLTAQNLSGQAIISRILTEFDVIQRHRGGQPQVELLTTVVEELCHAQCEVIGN